VLLKLAVRVNFDLDTAKGLKASGKLSEIEARRTKVRSTTKSRSCFLAGTYDQSQQAFPRNFLDTPFHAVAMSATMSAYQPFAVRGSGADLLRFLHAKCEAGQSARKLCQNEPDQPLVRIRSLVPAWIACV
jgi:hypothetical protein